MPEFEKLDPPASGGGGKHKPKFDKKQKMLLLGGGVAVVLVALFMSKAKGGGSTQEAVEEELKDYYTNYPTLGSQNSVVQDGMNTLVGRQEEIMNALLEATGKKAPELTNKLRTTFEDEGGALKAQAWLINQGIGATVVKKERIKDGWLGDRDYYTLEAYSSNLEQATELSAKGKLAGQWSAIRSETVKTSDAPKVGDHYRYDKK